jgi:hypothetical protein
VIASRTFHLGGGITEASPVVTCSQAEDPRDDALKILALGPGSVDPHRPSHQVIDKEDVPAKLSALDLDHQSNLHESADVEVERIGSAPEALP